MAAGPRLGGGSSPPLPWACLSLPPQAAGGVVPGCGAEPTTDETSVPSVGAALACRQRLLFEPPEGAVWASGPLWHSMKRRPVFIKPVVESTPARAPAFLLVAGQWGLRSPCGVACTSVLAGRWKSNRSVHGLPRLARTEPRAARFLVQSATAVKTGNVAGPPPRRQPPPRAVVRAWARSSTSGPACFLSGAAGT